MIVCKFTKFTDEIEKGQFVFFFDNFGLKTEENLTEFYFFRKDTCTLRYLFNWQHL